MRDKILWLHPFNKNIEGHGIFMYEQFNSLSNNEIYDIEEIYFNYKNISNLINIIIYLFKNKSRYQLVHVQWGAFFGLLSAIILFIVCKNKKIKMVISFRGSDILKYTGSNIPLKLHGRLSNKFSMISIYLFDFVIVENEEMVKLINYFHPSKQVVVLPAPVDVEKFSICRDGGDFDEYFNVLFSSFNLFNPIKRYHLAKAGFDLFNKNVKNAKFVLVNKVKHNDLKLIYNSSSVLLLTSTHEGWPNVVKEALSCGIPVISTNVSDLEVFFNENHLLNDLCFIVEPNAMAIATALKSLYSRSIDAADRLKLRKSIESFSFSSVNKKLIAHYRSLINSE